MPRPKIHIQRIGLPDHIFLIPRILEPEILKKIHHAAKLKKKLLNATVFTFPYHAVITGFIGYPHLYTLLEFIENQHYKTYYFLGTASMLNNRIPFPSACNVTKISAGSIFQLFSKNKQLNLNELPSEIFPKVTGISIDILQRETPSWVRKQKQTDVSIVEMELFPLRTFLKKPFDAIVVTTDRVTESGIHVCTDKQQIRKLFSQSYQYLESRIRLRF